MVFTCSIFLFTYFSDDYIYFTTKFSKIQFLCRHFTIFDYMTFSFSLFQIHRCFVDACHVKLKHVACIQDRYQWHLSCVNHRLNQLTACHVSMTPRDKTVLNKDKWLQNSHKDWRKLCTNPNIFIGKTSKNNNQCKGNCYIIHQCLCKQDTLEDGNKTSCCATIWLAKSKFKYVRHCVNDIML